MPAIHLTNETIAGSGGSTAAAGSARLRTRRLQVPAALWLTVTCRMADAGGLREQAVSGRHEGAQRRRRQAHLTVGNAALDADDAALNVGEAALNVGEAVVNANNGVQ